MPNFYREQILLLLLAFLLNLSDTTAQVNIALQLHNPACGGFSSGHITAIPIGGSAPYTYLWSTGSTANPLQNVPAGTYTVTVTDFQGVTGTATGVLTEPPPLEVSIVVTDCGLPGTMEGVITGGIIPLSTDGAMAKQPQLLPIYKPICIVLQ
ncbi:MAG: SprB repeat-containing protein [Saprospiraceae bacterium]